MDPVEIWESCRSNNQYVKGCELQRWIYQGCQRGHDHGGEVPHLEVSKGYQPEVSLLGPGAKNHGAPNSS